MPAKPRHRVLVISPSPSLRDELVTLLSGYGYFVEYSATRLEGIRKFRAHKQPIVIVDIPVLRHLPARLFRLFQMVRRNTIVLIAAHKKEEVEAFQLMRLGAYDVLNLPLKTDFLKLTLTRASSHHKMIIENIFVKNALFFGVLMLPVWVVLIWVLSR
jgi:DNA-binding NtrC family response regulator